MALTVPRLVDFRPGEFMNLVQLVRCAFGKHEHGTRISRDDDGVVRSRCVGCGRRMVRIEEGRKRTWQIQRKHRSHAEYPIWHF